MAPFCDICWKKDPFIEDSRMTLQRCCQCGVHFHNACYGRYGDAAFMERKDNLVCWACKSVGTTVKVRERDKETGKRLEFTIRERPTECCLCGVDDGERWSHAMHPVYDYHGPRGRQMVLPASEGKPKRLAWAHSLCCSSICSHRQVSGCVYGCDVKGFYRSDDVEEDEDDEVDDDESVNSDLQENDEAQGSIHHFVYILPQEKRTSKDKQELRRRRKRSDPGADWLRKIRQHQNNLKCLVCGKSDKPDSIRRIAVQCSANDVGEHDDFRGTHPDLARRESCCQALHIGCAIWGKSEGDYPKYRRLYFFPGLEGSDGYTPTVANLYCTLHAGDLLRHDIKGASTLRYPPEVRVSPHASRSLTHHTQLKGQSHSGTSPRTANRIIEPSVSPRAFKSVVVPSISPRTQKSVITTSSLLEKRALTEEQAHGLAARKKVKLGSASSTTAGVSSPKGMKKVVKTYSAVAAAPKPPPYERNSSAVLKHSATFKKKISRGQDLLTTKVTKRSAAAAAAAAAAVKQHAKEHSQEKESSFSMERQLKLPPHERQTSLGKKQRRGNETKHRLNTNGTMVGRGDGKKAAGDCAVYNQMLRDVLGALRFVRHNEKHELLSKFHGREKHWKRNSNMSSVAFKEAWKRLHETVWETLKIPVLKPKHLTGTKASSPKHLAETSNAAVARIPKKQKRASTEAAKITTPADSRVESHHEDGVGFQPEEVEEDDEEEFLFHSVEDMSVAKVTAGETKSDKSARELITQETADDSSEEEPASLTAAAQVSETTVSEAKTTDWSYLVVGKNYDPSRLNMGSWDTIEDLPLVFDV